MDDNKNFYISASIAFGSYLLLILIFVFYSSHYSVKKFDAVSKDTVLELDIILENTKTEALNHLKVSSSRKNSKISKKIVKKSTSTSAKQRSNLKSLFANVKTKSKVISKKEVNTVKKSSITSRFKSKFEKQTKSKNSAISKLLDTKDTKTSKHKAGESKHENDPYISKIYDILFKRWSPSVIIDGLSAKVIITIYSNGNFSYRLINNSGNDLFDSHLEHFLDKQTNQKFPVPEKNRIDIEVIFTAKG